MALQAFARVVELGGFTKAGDSLQSSKKGLARTGSGPVRRRGQLGNDAASAPAHRNDTSLNRSPLGRVACAGAASVDASRGPQD
jgi:hypothetical protein